MAASDVMAPRKCFASELIRADRRNWSLMPSELDACEWDLLPNLSEIRRKQSKDYLTRNKNVNFQIEESKDKISSSESGNQSQSNQSDGLHKSNQLIDDCFQSEEQKA